MVIKKTRRTDLKRITLLLFLLSTIVSAQEFEALTREDSTDIEG